MAAELDPVSLLQRMRRALGDTQFTIGGQPVSAWALGELALAVGALMVLGTERPWY